MKKNFINVLAALTLASAGVVSCVLEAPEINYQVNYQNVADFSGIIAAINNSTMSTQQRLDLIAESLDKQTYTMAQKIEFLEAALKNGLTNLEKASQMLKESLVKTINDQTLILNSKMTALETAVKSGTLTLGDKLEVIKTAINNQTASQAEASKLTREAFVAAITSQTATMKERLTALETAVKNETLVLSDKLSVIQTAINNQTIEETKALGLFKTAVNDAIASQKTTLSQALAAINTSVTDYNTAFQTKVDVLTNQIKTNGATTKECLDAINTSVKESAGSISDHIDLMAALVAGKIETGSGSIADKINAMGADLKASIDDSKEVIKVTIASLDTAIRRGTITLDEAIQGVTGAVTYQTGQIEVAAGVIADQVTVGAVTLRDGLAALKSGFDKQNEFIWAIGESLKQMLAEGNANLVTIKTAIEAAKEAIGTQTGAINDQTAWIAAVGNMVSGAIQGQTTDLTQIIGEVKTALGEQTTAINGQTAWIAAVGQGITDAIAANTTDIKTVLKQIRNAISEGALSLGQAINAVTGAVNSQTERLEVAAGVIADQVTVGAVTLRDGLAALKSGFDKENEFIWAIGETLKQMLADGNTNLGNITTAINEAKAAIVAQTGAISDQTAWINAVGNMVSGAIEGQTSSLGQIIEGVKTALGEQTTAINGQTAWIAAVGEGVSKAIAVQTTTLEAAINEVCYSVDAETDQLEAIYGILESCLKSGNVTITDAIRAVKDAVAGITNQIKSAEWIASLSQPIVTAIGNNQSALQEAILEISYSLQGEGEETISSQIALLTDILEGCLKSGDFTVADILNNMNQQLAAGNTNLEALKGAIKGTLVNAISAQTATLEEAIEAIGTAIDTTSAKVALQIETVKTAVEEIDIDFTDVVKALNRIRLSLDENLSKSDEKVSLLAAFGEFRGTMLTLYGENAQIKVILDAIEAEINGVTDSNVQDAVNKMSSLAAEVRAFTTTGAAAYLSIADKINEITNIITTHNLKDNSLINAAFWNDLKVAVESQFLVNVHGAESNSDLKQSAIAVIIAWDNLRIAKGEGKFVFPSPYEGHNDTCTAYNNAD